MQSYTAQPQQPSTAPNPEPAAAAPCCSPVVLQLRRLFSNLRPLMRLQTAFRDYVPWYEERRQLRGASWGQRATFPGKGSSKARDSGNIYHYYS